MQPPSPHKRRIPSPVGRKRTGDRTSRSPSPDRRTRPRPRPSPRTGDRTSRRNPRPDMRAQKHSKPLLYWTIASFIGRCELHALAEDFVACGERMGFKICPPLVFQENTDQYLTCPADIRVNEMCTCIMRCSPDFILCIVDEYSGIREIWRTELSKLQIDTHCISLPDTNRQGFLERVLVEIHSKPDEPIVEDDDEDDDDKEDDDKDEDDAVGGSNRGGKVLQGISNSS